MAAGAMALLAAVEGAAILVWSPGQRARAGYVQASGADAVVTTAWNPWTAHKSKRRS